MAIKNLEMKLRFPESQQPPPLDMNTEGPCSGGIHHRLFLLVDKGRIKLTLPPNTQITKSEGVAGFDPKSSPLVLRATESAFSLTVDGPYPETGRPARWTIDCLLG